MNYQQIVRLSLPIRYVSKTPRNHKSIDPQSMASIDHKKLLRRFWTIHKRPSTYTRKKK